MKIFLNKVESKILFTKGIGAYPLNYFNVGKFGFSEFSASDRRKRTFTQREGFAARRTRLEVERSEQKACRNAGICQFVQENLDYTACDFYSTVIFGSFTVVYFGVFLDRNRLF